MATYRFLLVDFATGEVRTQLPLASASWTEQLNGVGSFSGVMRNEYGGYLLDEFAPDRSVLVVERDGKVLWVGLIWGIQRGGDVDASTLTINGSGLFSYYHHKLLDVTFALHAGNNLSQGTPSWAAAGVLARASGLRIGTEPVLSVSSFADGPNPDITDMDAIEVKWDEYKTIGPVIEDLAKRGVGFDHSIEAEWKIVPGETAKLIAFFVTHYPRKGDRHETGFVTGVNVRSYEFAVDFSSRANRIVLTGEDWDGVKMAVDREANGAHWPDWQPEDWRGNYPNFPFSRPEGPYAFPPPEHASTPGYPVLEAVSSHSGGTTLSELDRIAGNILAYRRTIATAVSNLVPLEPSEYVGRVVVGDELPVLIDDGLVQVSPYGLTPYLRVLETTTSMTADGEENWVCSLGLTVDGVL